MNEILQKLNEIIMLLRSGNLNSVADRLSEIRDELGKYPYIVETHQVESLPRTHIIAKDRMGIRRRWILVENVRADHKMTSGMFYINQYGVVQGVDSGTVLVRYPTKVVRPADEVPVYPGDRE